MANVPYTHSPGAFFTGNASGATPDNVDQGGNPFTLPRRASRDPRVEWSHKTATTLKQESSTRIKEIERNVKFYNGEQWAANRAPWKNNVVINYAAWTCDQWTALLCDNKPRFVYEPIRLADEAKAEIATAMREFDETRNEWDRKREEAVLVSRIKKEAYYTLRYDPSINGGEGGIDLKVLSPDMVFRDSMSTSVEDANTILLEYPEAPGAILERFPKLRRKIERYQTDSWSKDDSDADEIAVPGQMVESTSGPIYNAPRHAPAAERPGGGSSGGVMVREWWLRPKGPKHQVKIKKLRWNAANRIATRKKFIKFKDGSLEPLQTVVTEGNVVYELPLSIVSLLQFGDEAFRGIKILGVQDALEAIMEEKMVPKYPAGRRLVIVGDHVADDGANPFAHQEIPLVHLRARVDGRTGKAVGDIDNIWKMCEFLNRLDALLLDAAIQTSNPVWIVPIDEQMSDEDLTNAPGAIIRTSPMASKLLRREQGASMPQYVMNLMQFMVGQIREISGLSETATGGKFKGQQSAETVSMYQESASVRFRQAIRLIEQAEVRLGRQYLALCSQFYHRPMLVKTKDSLGIDRHITFLGNDLTQDMLMKAKAGSGLPSSPSARMNTIMSLYKEGLIDMPEVYKVLQENGAIESAIALQKRIQYYITHPDQAWKMPQLFAQLHAADNKKGGKANTKNAGRSARSTTAKKAQAA